MLELKQIVKDYQAGDTAVHALKGMNSSLCWGRPAAEKQRF